jgi:hypothetical protein
VRQQERQLTVGVLVEQPPARWVASAVAAIASDSSVRRTVILGVDSRVWRRPARRGPGRAALRLFARLDALAARPTPDAFAPSVIGPELERLTVLESTPDEVGALVREHELDLLVNLSRLDVRPEAVPSTSRFGIWELRHGSVAAAHPHGLFHEFAFATKTCVSTLVRRDAGSELVLYSSTSAVGRLSLQRARNAVYWKSATFPARALRLLALGQTQPQAAEADDEERPSAEAPGLADVALLQLKLARRALAYATQRLLQRSSWAIVWQAREQLGLTGEFEPNGVLEPPPRRAYADPFLVADGDNHYLFYEDYREDARRATIAVSRVVDGRIAPGRAVMAAPYHLSYPFTFGHDGDYFLVPESANARVVQLFRATRFPYEWELDSTLLSGIAAYDATLIREHDHWYLFAAVAAAGADIDELHVFWSRSLRGPYLPHPLNPVVSDARRARPAGRIFRDGDRLVRPGQDASAGYGSALWLSEIEELSRTTYRERPFVRLDARWASSARGTHTLDHAGGIQVMDVKYLRPRWRAGARVPVAT